MPQRADGASAARQSDGRVLPSAAPRFRLRAVLRWLAPLLAALALVGCAAPEPFRCDREGASCTAPGVCVAGYCAVPGAECVSGWRYTRTAARPNTCAMPGADAAVDAATSDAPTADLIDVPPIDLPPPDAPIADAPALDGAVPPDVVEASDVVDVPEVLDVPGVLDAPDVVDARPTDAPTPDVPITDVPITDVPTTLSTTVAFRRPLTSPGGSSAVLAMAVGDVDGDTFLDAAVATIEGQVDLYRGVGDGRFTRALSMPVTGVRALLLADLNGDLRADLVTLGTTVSVSYARTGFTFTEPLVLGPVAGGTTLRLAQVYGSDAPDLLVAVPGNTRIVVFPGPFSAVGLSTTFVSPVRPDVMEVADLDGDGIAEVLVLNTSGVGPWVGVLRGERGGPGTVLTQSFSPMAAASSAVTARGLVVGDTNGDNDPDLVIVDDGGITFADNPGGRMLFNSFGRIVIGAPVTGGAAARYNGDRLADVAILGAGDGLVHLFRSPFTGTPTPLTFAVPGNIAAAVPGDFNNDHADDLLVYADGLHLLAGNNTGALSAPRAFLTCNTPGDTVVTRLAGPTIRHVVVGCGATVSVHGILPTLPFLDPYADAFALPLGLTADTLLGADLLGDESLDLVASSRTTLRSQILRAVEGTLDVDGPFTTGSRVVAGAIDAMAGTDLVFALNGNLELLTNRGGAFESTGRVSLTGRSFVDLGVADLDGDARTELLGLDSARDEVVAVTATTVGTLETTSRAYAVADGADRMLTLSTTATPGLDLVLSYGTGRDVRVHRRAGATLNNTGRSDVTNSTLAGMVGGPVSPDRCDDVVTWHASGRRIDVHAADCLGGLAPHVELPTFAAARVSLVDFDGDGRRDLLVTHRPAGVRAGYFSVWINVAR